MNSPQPSNGTQPPPPPPPAVSVDDILFTFFRHRWLILGFFCLGIAAAMFVRIMKPPLFMSHAKLMIHYIEELKLPPGADPSQFQAVHSQAQGILNAEKEIIRNLDVAREIARAIGPQRLLSGKTNDLEAAAGLVCGSLDVDVPATMPILTVSFRHKDRNLVQPVVNALIDAYLMKHSQVHNPELDALYRQQRDELRQKLATVQEELTAIMASNSIISIEATKQFLQEQRAKWQNDLNTTQVELAGHRAVLSDATQAAMTSGGTNSLTVPRDVLEQYSTLLFDLANYKKNEKELMRVNRFTEFHPLVMTVKGQIEQLNKEKASYLQRYPALMDMADTSLTSTNSIGSSLAVEVNEIKKLTSRIDTVSAILAGLETHLAKVLAIEPRINDLTWQRDMQATNLAHLSKTLDGVRITDSMNSGKPVNIGVIERPTPPEQDRKKLTKMLGMAFAGCIGLGIGLAFLIDRLLDRSIKRSVDIERHLRLPVFLTIPDSGWNGRLRLPWERNPGPGGGNGANGNGNGSHSAVTVWDPVHQLTPYAAGLSERLMTYFEVNNLAQKRPKLVGLTGCARGAGVTSLATGLAASLSKTGSQSVLLVDMNVDEGVARPFYQGKPACGILDPYQTVSHAEAETQDHMHVTSLKEGGNGQALQLSNFQSFMPQLNASDYEYIIFDLPPVSQTSSTPRFSGYVDITLLVVEAEKTSQQSGQKATKLMQDARAKVATVLNKYRQHVPAPLAPEL